MECPLKTDGACGKDDILLSFNIAGKIPCIFVRPWVFRRQTRQAAVKSSANL
jgi:hypothetical protein